MRFRRRRRGRTRELGNTVLKTHHPLVLLAVSLIIVVQSASSLNSDISTTSSQTSGQNQGKRTLYACEEKQLEIECQLGESIQLIRANYGRFSIQICNEQGQLDWKVNCMSSDSFETIARSCQSKQSCQLLASNAIFGDACPGTQKYIEVHYQCVQANRTSQDQQQQQQQLRPPKVAPQTGPKPVGTIKTGNDVIQPNLAAPMTTTSATNSISTAASLSESQARSNAPPSPNWPNWIPSVLETPSPAPIPRPGQCPELIARGMRWPETPAGLLAYTTCPSHALPSDATVRPAAAVALLCKPDGQWADRAQMFGRCQSLWLRNLAVRHETGDSPLSILSELVHRTQPVTPATGAAAATTGSSHHHNQHQQPQQHPASQPANWLAYATSSLGDSMSRLPPAGQANLPLFGEDLVQMSRMVGKLVEEFGELLARISDDKQRITFAREMIQLIVDLTSNLADRHHTDAWWDLASVGAAPTGDRQRVAGQLLGALESGSVLLAGAIQHQARPQAADQPEPGRQQQPEDFQKLTEHVYVAIQSIVLDRSRASQRLQVTFPSTTSLMGARWINPDQRFTLNLQVNSEQQQQQDQLQAAGKVVNGPRQLKIVSVMLRGLGAYMEPGVLQQQQQQIGQEPGDKSKFQGGETVTSKRLTVNSDLVGLSIVADSPAAAQGSAGAAANQVDLAAPVELVFRHLHSGQPPTSRPPVCAFWDGPTSDWSTNGCRLAASNRTHSVCACDHLTTFGLLSELDQRQTTANMLTSSSDDAQQQPTSGPAHNQPRPMRVHLDRVEDELLFSVGGSEQAIYMARLLEGDLFSGQPSSRTLVYISCCLSGLLLALLLAAAAYTKAQARRLLGSLPAEAPPSLLVANYHSQRHYQAELHAANSVETSTTTNGTSPPTSYSSSAGANHPVASGNGGGGTDLLANNKHQEHSELNGFYSLASNQDQHSNYYGINRQQQHLKSRLPLSSQSSGAQRYLAANKSISQLGLVPCHLVVQQLLLQLLLLLLIESQNLIAWNSQQQRSRDNLLLMDFANSPQPRQLESSQLDPLNWLTWSAVFALYYLVSTLVYWLLTRLLQLSGHLIGLNGLVAHPAAGLSAARPYQSIRTISSNALYQQPPPAQPLNRYGPCQIHHNANSSPSLSNFPSVLAEPNRLDHTDSHGFLTKESASSGLGAVGSLACPLAARLATSKRLARLLTHGLPLLSASLLVWFSLERGHSINLVAFTLSWSSQLVYWPLALEAGWPVPLAVYLYCLPGICLALGVLALFMLRRHLNQFYSTPAATSNSANKLGPPHTGSAVGSPSSVFKSSVGYQPEGDSDSAQSETRRRPAGGHLALELPFDSMRAKLTCLTLLALLALSSICWISFFTHCHQALSHATRSSLNAAAAATATTSSYSNHLILTFASSNLLISLLICCSQRKQVRRAGQLLGLSRLFSLVAGHCCCCRRLAEAHQTSPGSSSVCSSSYYNNHNNQNQCAPIGLHYGTTTTSKPISKAAGISQQSLFGLSRSRPDLSSNPQPNYNPQAYGVLQHQLLADQQQHLYQQLAAASSQQHIYDSATNLNSPGELAEQQQKQRQWNALQIMAQQHQQQFNQQQQHEPMIHYTLGARPFNGQQQQQQFHLNQQQQQQQQAFFHQTANMTLKPLPAMSGPQMSRAGARNKPHESFMCPISAGLEHGAGTKTNPASSSAGSSSGPGEADGPLVALSQSSPPIVSGRRHELASTIGPADHSHLLLNSNNNSYHQQLHQRAIEQRPSSDKQSSKQVLAGETNRTNQDGRPPISAGHHNQMDAGGQEANRQHFRRANSNATGRRAPPHESFASSNVMMDVQFDYSRRTDGQQHQADGGASGIGQREVGNIYDVANCGQVANC